MRKTFTRKLIFYLIYFIYLPEGKRIFVHIKSYNIKFLRRVLLKEMIIFKTEFWLTPYEFIFKSTCNLDVCIVNICDMIVIRQNLNKNEFGVNLKKWLKGFFLSCAQVVLVTDFPQIYRLLEILNII